MTDYSNIRPCGERILVRRDIAPDRVGSILLPEQSQERPMRGTVVAVGSGKRVAGAFRPLETKVGDVVRYSAKGRPEFTMGGELHQMIVEADIFGIEEAVPAVREIPTIYVSEGEVV